MRKLNESRDNAIKISYTIVSAANKDLDMISNYIPKSGLNSKLDQIMDNILDTYSPNDIIYGLITVYKLAKVDDQVIYDIVSDFANKYVFSDCDQLIANDLLKNKIFSDNLSYDKEYFDELEMECKDDSVIEESYVLHESREEELEDSRKVAFALFIKFGKDGERIKNYVPMLGQDDDIDMALGTLMDTYGQSSTLFGLATAYRLAGLNSLEVSAIMNNFLKRVYRYQGFDSDEVDKLLLKYVGDDPFGQEKLTYIQGRFDNKKRSREPKKYDFTPEVTVPSRISGKPATLKPKATLPPTRRLFVDNQPAVVQGGLKPTAKSNVDNTLPAGLDDDLDNLELYQGLGRSIDKLANAISYYNAERNITYAMQPDNNRVVKGLHPHYIMRYLPTNVGEFQYENLFDRNSKLCNVLKKEINEKLGFKPIIKDNIVTFDLMDTDDPSFARLYSAFTYKEDPNIILFSLRADADSKRAGCVLTTLDQVNKDLDTSINLGNLTLTEDTDIIKQKGPMDSATKQALNKAVNDGDPNAVMAIAKTAAIAGASNSNDVMNALKNKSI